MSVIRRLDGRAWPRIFRRCRWRRAKLRGHRIDVVIFCAERHGTRPALCLDRLNDGVFIGSVLVRHGDRAIATRCEHQTRTRVEAVRVYALANRNGGAFVPVR
jgi:hypothetical protein